MVQKEQLEELFEYDPEGYLVGKYVPWRRKESNTRVVGKRLGTKMKQGHLQVNFRTKDGIKHRMLVHRIIFYLCKGYLPEFIDHRDRNPLNNKIENLRQADKSLNSINRGPQCNTRFGQRGVYKVKTCNSYQSYITNKGERIYLGSYSSPEEAIQARLKAEEEYWGDVR